MQDTLSETTAIRLYNSVVATGRENGTISSALGRPLAEESQGSSDSLQSSNEFGNSCRICRWNRGDMDVIRSPCLCKGSVGYIHMQCLRRWILHRGDSRCEICNTRFNLPVEKQSIQRRIRSFWSTRVFGAIAKQVLFSMSLVPLTHVILSQVLFCMENLNQNHSDQLSVQEVLVASFALLTSSAVFFHFFEYSTTRMFVIRNILRQWWMFGGSSDFSLLDVELDAENF